MTIDAEWLVAALPWFVVVVMHVSDGGRTRALLVLERFRTERVGTPDFDVLTEAIRRVSS